MKHTFARVNWGLAVVLSLLSIAACLASIAKVLFGWSNIRTWYWLAMLDLSRFATAFFILLPASLLYIVIVRIAFQENDRQQNISAAVILLMLASFMLLCAASWIAPLFQTGILGYREHIKSVRNNGHIYHLHYYDSDPAEGYNGIFYLYECDSLDILCQPIHSVLRTTGGIEPDIEEIHLISNSQENTIALEINGKITFTLQGD